MSLKPIKSMPRTRRIVTFDFEWLPKTYQLRVAGVFDGESFRHYGEDRYKPDEIIDAFLMAECKPRNRGAWLFAHAGGLADMIFVLPRLIKKGWKVEGWFSGSSMVICEVENEHGKFTFCDSYFLLRARLADIGAKFGMAKGDVSWDAPFSQLLEYNKRDCELLHRAIIEFQATLQGLGGELRPTVASCALSLFRRSYLSRPIQTHKLINDTLQEHYFGGRVEAFYRGQFEHAWYMDINSCYPTVMLDELPGSLRKFGRNPVGSLWFADCTVNVPAHIERPPLPVKVDGKLYFPTGRISGIWASDELAYAESLGCRIIRISQSWSYYPTTDFRDYAQDLYDKRMSSESEAHRMIYKILLNSLYGKFGQREEKDKLLINPDTRPGPEAHMITPGMYLVPEHGTVMHRHIPLAAMVTAKARVLLGRKMDMAGSVYYCDTDGIITPNALPISSELGGLKLEMEVTEGEIVEPKFYKVTNGTKTMVKAKGFSLGRSSKQLTDNERLKLSIEQWERIRDGKKHPTERMVRVRGLLKHLRDDPTFDGTPWDVELDKGRHNMAPKRYYGADGTSRPWSIDEILNAS